MDFIIFLGIGEVMWKVQPNRSLFDGMPTRREIDPGNFDSKFTFWSDRVLQCQMERREAQFSLNSTSQYCTWNGLLPLCLPAVIVSCLLDVD